MEDSTKQVYISPQSNPSVWPIAIKFGLMGAAYFVIVNLIQFLTGMMDLEKMAGSGGGFDLGAMMMGLGIAVVNWAVFTFIYYLAVKAYRTELGGFITFGQGFKAAFFSVLIKAAAVLVWGLIFYLLIHPSFCEQMLDFVAEAMMQQGTGGDEDAMEMIMNIYSYVYSPIGMSIMLGFSTITGGALLSLAAAAIGQKEPAA